MNAPLLTVRFHKLDRASTEVSPPQIVKVGVKVKRQSHNVIDIGFKSESRAIDQTGPTTTTRSRGLRVDADERIVNPVDDRGAFRDTVLLINDHSATVLNGQDDKKIEPLVKNSVLAKPLRSRSRHRTGGVVAFPSRRSHCSHRARFPRHRKPARQRQP